MRRVVSVWLPDWPITRRFGTLRTSPPEGPFALAERTARGLVITAANRTARTTGVRIGQTHADAKALCPGLESAAAEPEEDARALARLALWCERFSPSVATDRIGPRLDGLTLDVTGAGHLWGGEAGLLADIEARLKAAGVPCRAALADTVGAAWALARFGSPKVGGRLIAPDGTKTALADLPVEALRLAEPTLVLLKRLGLRRIGALYPLPRAALARRFQGAAKAGEAALQVVLRLDQALGETGEAVAAVCPPPTYRVWRVFAEPILITEGVDARVPELVDALAAQLERDGRGARRLALTAFRVDGRAVSLEVGFSVPAKAPAHLARVLRDAGLERLDLGFGADALMLTAPEADAVGAEQSGLDQDAVTGDLPSVLDRIGAKLGPSAVRRPAPHDSWIPERSEVLGKVDSARPARAAMQNGDGGTADSARPAIRNDDGGMLDTLRPILLLDPPEPADGVVARLPDHPPRGFTWRSVRRRVVRAQGPERIAPEWWRDGLPPPPDDAERPVLKVAREDVLHIERQNAARPAKKTSAPGVCVPALPAATGLEGRAGLKMIGGLDYVPAGRTLDGYGRAANEAGPQPSPPGEGRGEAAGWGTVVPSAASPCEQRLPTRPASGEPPSPGGEGWSESAPDLPLTRDYFLVEDDAGERFWLFRDGLYGRETSTPTWWVHGVCA